MGPALEIEVPRYPSAAADVRDHIERACRGRFDDEAVQNLKLVATELVSNAVRHGEGRIVIVRVEQPAPSHVRVEVVDGGSGAALDIRERDHERMDGRGLQIVDSLADRWGAFEGTTHVWAEIPVRAA